MVCRRTLVLPLDSCFRQKPIPATKKCSNKKSMFPTYKSAFSKLSRVQVFDRHEAIHGLTTVRSFYITALSPLPPRDAPYDMARVWTILCSMNTLWYLSFRPFHPWARIASSLTSEIVAFVTSTWFLDVFSLADTQITVKCRKKNTMIQTTDNQHVSFSFRQPLITDHSSKNL